VQPQLFSLPRDQAEVGGGGRLVLPRQAEVLQLLRHAQAQHYQLSASAIYHALLNGKTSFSSEFLYENNKI
jgi:hypothetical protein